MGSSSHVTKSKHPTNIIKHLSRFAIKIPEDKDLPLISNINSLNKELDNINNQTSPIIKLFRSEQQSQSLNFSTAINGWRQALQLYANYIPNVVKMYINLNELRDPLLKEQSKCFSKYIYPIDLQELNFMKFIPTEEQANVIENRKKLYMLSLSLQKFNILIELSYSSLSKIKDEAHLYYIHISQEFKRTRGHLEALTNSNQIFSRAGLNAQMLGELQTRAPSQLEAINKLEKEIIKNQKEMELIEQDLLKSLRQCYK